MSPDIISEMERLLQGQPRPLSMPESHIAEYMQNGKDLLDPQKQEDREGTGWEAVGYQFVWGQLLESCDVPVTCWEIRFDNLHRKFLEAGGNGNELADLAVLYLGKLESAGQMPRFLYVDDSDLGSTSAAIYLNNSLFLPQTRRFLANTFCPQLMPRMIGWIVRINKKYAKK